MTESNKHEHESPITEEELAWRMGSSAGRRLTARLQELEWTAGGPAPSDGEQ